MKPNKAFLHFLENDAGSEYQRSLLALDQYYDDNRQQLVEDCTEALIRCFHHICQVQGRGHKKKIAYIYASFLYTSLQEGQGTYRLDAYDQEWFFDPIECTTEYNALWAYGFLHELGERWNQTCKQYAGKITRYDIELLKRMEACKFSVYVDAVMHQAVKLAVQSPEFAGIKKEEVLEIFIGEYKDQCRTLYRHDSRSKDSGIITKQITENPADDYAFAVWEHLDFKEIQCRETDLRYVSFTGSTMTNLRFDQALLWGSDFTHTQIINTHFIRSEMPGADFSHAELSGCQFTKVDAEPCGLERETYIGIMLPARFYKAKLTQMQFHETSLNEVTFEQAVLMECQFNRCDMQYTQFQGTTLSDCTFSFVDFREADLRGAIITACDFSTSDLAGAIFSVGTDLKQLGLTIEQIQQVILT